MTRTLTLLLLLAAAFGSTAQAQQTLVAHYPFDGNANDVSAFANNATVGGATLVTGYDGKPNGAYSFDGNRDSIFAPAAPQLNTPEATYTFWVKVDSLVKSGEYYLFSYGGYQDRIKMSLPSHGYPVMTTNTVNGIKDGDANPESLKPGVWTHLSFVHARDTNFIYINGKLAKFEFDDKTKGGLNPTNKVLGVGYDAAFTGSYFSGDIDELRIYGGGLTRTEVATLYSSFSPSVGLREVNFTEVGKLYPNPATGSVTFENSISDQSARYELNDMLGRTIGRGYVNSPRQQIDLAGVPAGTYVMRVFGDEVQSSSKFFVE